MEKNKQVFFTAESSLQKIRNYILDIISLSIIIYCLFKFYENPVLISIIISFLLFMLLISGYNKVVVYADRVEFKVQHSIDKLSKRCLLQFSDIESINANLQLTKKGFILFEILSSYIPGGQIWNTLTITLANGKTIIINTKVYKEDLIKALNAITSVTRGSIVIDGVSN